MDGSVCKRAASVGFWDVYARWYRLWFEHTRYHDRIIEVLMERVRPGWKVLDIGAGNGVLCWPLCVIGCDVTALEPSIGMRSLLYEEGFRRGIDWIKVDERRWEDYQWFEGEDYDLVLACNSLHFTEIGFDRALDRVFKMQPKNIFLITERDPRIKVKLFHKGYRILFSRFYSTDSSFAYHSIEEFLEHYAFKKGRSIQSHEIPELLKLLHYEQNHYWVKDTAIVGMYWWIRIL